MAVPTGRRSLAGASIPLPPPTCSQRCPSNVFAAGIFCRKLKGLRDIDMTVIHFYPGDLHLITICITICKLISFGEDRIDLCRTRKDIACKVQSAHFQTLLLVLFYIDVKTMHSKFFIIVSKIIFLPRVNTVVGPNMTVVVLLLISFNLN